MNLKLRELLDKFKQRWLVLTQTKKVLMIVGAAAILAALLYLIPLAIRPNYVPLFSGLEPREAGSIVEKLNGMGVQYRLADEGKTIEVSEEQVYDVRIQLASSGVLAGGDKGFELFDQSKLGITDFEQQVDYQRALQGELQRTIIQLEEIEQARVHLVLPQKSVFIEESGAASASIVLKLRPSAELKPEQVRGIIDLVVGSVEGIKAEDVHIIDTRGRILSDDADVSDDANITQVTLKQQQIKRDFEKELEKRIQHMLERIVGPGRAVAMVTADLDFNKQQSTTITYTDGPVVSEQSASEQGNGFSGTGGVPGTGTNLQDVPTYPGLTPGGADQNYSREDTVTNYQVGSREETVIQAPGVLRRLSTSVVVDGDLSVAMEEQIFNVVASAVGYDVTRDDLITVQSMAFDTSYKEQINAEMAVSEAKMREEERMKALVYLGIAGTVLLVAGLIWLIIWFRRARNRRRERLEALLEEPVSIKEIEAEEDITKNVYYDSKQDEVRAYARSRPQDVADVLRIWLSDDK